ncbi:MAG: SsrA-binding protein SmpB [Saprospiraceae bacterium]|nr:SsrA-binding protein SmpB [Saprospiraceae bacterium]
MKSPEIINRKATHEFQFIQLFEAGMQLSGTEVKSIRAGNANLSDAWCGFDKGELWIKNLHISEYESGSDRNHEPKRPRKLLLNKLELKKLERKIAEKGMTIVPYRIYFSDRGMIKVEIALATGKKSFDKRESIKDRDVKRELNRNLKLR